MIGKSFDLKKPKMTKKHSPIPLKYIDVIRSTHTDFDVTEEAVRFVDRFHKIHFIERHSSTRIYLVWEETDKNPNDITCRSHMA